MRKLLSPPAIVFKGSGWAKKDFRDARSSAKADKESVKSGSGDGTSKSAGADGGAKSDSPPAAKSTEGPSKQISGTSSTPAKAAD
jgi:predicted nucleic acid-binding Zn ribbon protein